MPRIYHANLLENTRVMYDTELRWRSKTWKESLKNHDMQLDELWSLIAVFDSWKNRLPKNEATKCVIQ